MKNPIELEQIKPWFLGTIGIMGSAMKILLGNLNFITFNLITSFPLFCMMKFIPRSPYDFWQPSFIMEASLELRRLITHPGTLKSSIPSIQDWTIRVLDAWLFDMIKFLVALTSIYSASIFYTTSVGKSMSLRYLVQSSVTKIWWPEPIITYFSLSLISSIFLEGFRHWLRARPTNLYLIILQFFVPFVAVAKWLEFKALTNVAVVVSVLEDNIRGPFEAYSTSSELSRGNRLRGLVLIILHSSVLSGLKNLFKWSFSSIPAYHFIQNILYCLQWIMFWVVFTIYYYDCKNRHKSLS
ncbi:hypothetical protein RchiOBHm_Chr4g0444091 [Rosa chinensis]|uniref:Uncharacterized protein n=1 Tax=Rosa chinensis TaxID=74649 RepID=A0A2P6R4A0_ROSCH|nr:hypothetical protein RchiOBHm_Chr4g0444091 [Rosa chinensis]